MHSPAPCVEILVSWFLSGSALSPAASAVPSLLSALPVLEYVLVNSSGLGIGPEAVQLAHPVVDDWDPQLIWRFLFEIVP